MTRLIRRKLSNPVFEGKTLYYVLKSFSGIGVYKTQKILIKLGLAVNTLKKKLKDLPKEYKDKLYRLIVREVKGYAPPLPKMETLKTYKNYRYVFNLPLRGQRTKTNAQTSKKRKKKI